jgi:hypothetical protein
MILKIFLPKIWQKIGVFDSKQSKLMQKYYHNIGLWENAIFRRKLSKIAENCDHNIDPSSDTTYLAQSVTEYYHKERINYYRKLK